MPEGNSVVADGIRCQIYYFTGKVLSSQKQKETRVSSQNYGTGNQAQVHVSSTTVDHHEFFMVDSAGKERSFKTVNFDFPCREGNTLTVVWAIAEGKNEGPFLEVHNHNTGERHVNSVSQIASWFSKPAWMVWGLAFGAFLLVGLIISWVLAFVALIGIPLYFNFRAKKAAKELLASDGLRQLDSELAQVKPVAA
jgi:hypothetical protein